MESITASHLTELIDTVKHRLCLSVNQTVTLVLEEDGTEILDEEYFQALHSDTVLMLLLEHQNWSPPNQISIQYSNNDEDHRSLTQLSLALRTDLSNIATFSSSELETIVDCSADTLKVLLADRANDADSIQEACQRALDAKQELMDATQLLNLLFKYGFNPASCITNDSYQQKLG